MTDVPNAGDGENASAPAAHPEKDCSDALSRDAASAGPVRYVASPVRCGDCYFDAGPGIVAVAAGIPQRLRRLRLKHAGVVPGPSDNAQWSGLHVHGERPAPPRPLTGRAMQVGLPPAAP